MSSEDPFAPQRGTPAAGGGLGGGEEAGVDLLDTVRLYLGGLRRRWKLVALMTAAGLAAGAVHYLVTPPVYQAETTLLIERRSANSLLSQQLPWLDHYFNIEFYPTQYRLLQSRGLAEQVALDLRLAEEPSFSRAAGGGDAGSRGADRAALGRVANKLRGGLAVTPVRDTQLVELTYRTEDPEQAARIANAYAEAFIEFSIRTRSETMTETSDVLTEEVARLKDEVGKLEEQVAAYSLSDMLPLSSGETGGALQRLESLNNDLMTARRDRFETEARYRELGQMPAEAVAAATASPLVAELRAEKSRLEREYDSKSEVYKSGWPEMQELRGRIERTGEQLRQAVADEARRVRQAAYAEYQASLREEQAVAGEIQRLKGQMSSENSDAVELANLQVELRSRRGLLDDLVRRQSETTFATRLQTDKSSNVRVVDRALVPGSPTQPSLPQDLGAGTTAGLLLGLGLGLLLQFLDRTVKSPEELERLSGLPVLAVVPDVSDAGQGYGYAYQYGYGEGPAEPKGRRWREKKNGGGDKVPIELLPHARPRLAVSETYRALRTALLLSTARELRVVALTSVESSEGKTATAANLAVVLAQLGRRVLLIDGDLRKPRLHKVFGVSNRAGLVTYLTTGAADGLTHRTEVGGLSVMASGPIPPNPSELLASDRMRDLLARLRESFDYVVIDSPPSLAVTDATILGAMADGVVVCVRSGRVQRQDLVRVLDRLRRADVKLLGTLLNAHRSGGGGSNASYKAYRAYIEDAPEAETGSAA